MDDSTLPKKRWQIRVLSGPARGTTRVLTGRRLTIGRAASADLHLPSSKISRQHAQILEDDQGRHVLVDLSSSNGTFVSGLGIQRHVLEPDTAFSIVDVELTYEEACKPAAGHPRAPAADGSTLRGTAQLDRCEAPTVDYPTADALREQAAETMVPGLLTDASGDPLLFETPDGGVYEGDLLDDILEYRSLRAQHLRGGFSEPGQRRLLEELKQRLQQPVPSSDPSSAQRAFCRFECWVQGRLRIADGGEHPCRVRDLGVDGAQLVMEEHAPGPETVAWLTIEVRGEHARLVVLAGRVAWTDDERVGLAFAGAPRRDHGRYAERPGPQGRRDQLEAHSPQRRLRLSLSVDRS